MIKFSWQKINNKFDWNAFSVLEYFFLMQNLKVPPYLRQKIPRIVRNAAAYHYEPGPCFIININEAMKAANHPNELYLYLELASKRNVFDYLVRGVKYLPIQLAEEYQIEWVELNPMMKIENDKILFKYEQERKQYGY